MTSSREDMVMALERLPGLKALVIGDVILDRYIWGAVERISPEAPVPVVDVRRTEDRLGGAGNVVRNLVALGAKVSLCGFIGDDDEGKIALDHLRRDHVRVDGVIVDRTRPTALKTRVIAHSQQVVRIDRESKVVQAVALREGFAAVIESELEDADLVIISDYGKGAISEPAIRKLEEARLAGKLTLKKRPLVFDPAPANYSLYKGMTVAKPNRKEAEVAAGILINSPETALDAAHKIKERWQAELVVITLGEGGMMLLGTGAKDGVHIPTVAQEVYDVSGAGDTVTAILSAALGAGIDAVVAASLANIGAGIAVSEVGTVAVDRARISEELEMLD